VKVLAVGDIHTKMWIIDAVRKIADEYDRIVFVGDYADDFNASPALSIQTWKELRSFSHSEPKVKLVTGNHDYIYVNNTPTKQSGYNYVTQTLINAPENKGLKEWLRNLSIICSLDGVTYTHAGITESFDGERMDVIGLWQDNSPLWARPGQFDWHGSKDEVYKNIPQVFGHTPSETCWEVQPNIWCIDTFSTYSSGDPIGDHTALEITDGKKFNKVKIKNDNNSITSIKTGLPRTSH
jgi:predicted MPP superfamily phosphohydrolase